jgi:superfamily II DNA helicase RecQ
MCCLIQYLLSGGITLVIEPYNALIESQLDNIRGMVGIEVEKLF